MTTLHLRGAAALLLAALAGSAAAHTGHGTESLFQGLAHPFGVDHLLAMVAVGVWSAAAFQGARRWLGPITFLSAMALGAGLAFGGLVVPWVEPGLAVSVIAFGAMLAFATRTPAGPGLLLVAASALLHGLAHGAELPGSAQVVAYATGFLATTALLHVGGLALGSRLLSAAPRLWQGLGALLGSAGLTLLMRL